MGSPINTVGTKMYVAATANELNATSTAADVTTSIGTGKEIDCVIDLGSLNTTRAIKETSCVNNGVTYKSLGTKNTADVSIQMFFDSSDVKGQDDLRTLFGSAAKRTMIIALNDAADLGLTTNTTFHFEGSVSGVEYAFEKDGIIGFNATVNVSGDVVTIDAA